MKTYWIYYGCWKRVTPEKYLAYDGIKEIREDEIIRNHQNEIRD